MKVVRFSDQITYYSDPAPIPEEITLGPFHIGQIFTPETPSDCIDLVHALREKYGVRHVTYADYIVVTWVPGCDIGADEIDEYKDAMGFYARNIGRMLAGFSGVIPVGSKIKPSLVIEYLQRTGHVIDTFHLDGDFHIRVTEWPGI